MIHILVSTSLLVVSAVAQISNVTHCIPEYNWALNSFGQTPCLVAASLEGLCSNKPFSMNSIPAGTHYLGPASGEADNCKCSSVVYSLVSACGGCQNRTFVKWPDWTVNCAAVEVSSFPLPTPSSTQIPSWAFLNITLTNSTFNPLVAQDEAIVDSQGIPASTQPQLLSTSTSSTSARTSTSTSATSSASPSLTQSTSLFSTSASISTQALPSDFSEVTSKNTTSSNAGAIAGGVVGGASAVSLLGLLFFWRHLRKIKKRGVYQEPTYTLSATPFATDSSPPPGVTRMPMQSSYNYSTVPTNTNSRSVHTAYTSLRPHSPSVDSFWGPGELYSQSGPDRSLPSSEI